MGKQLDLIEDATTRKRVVLVTDGEPVAEKRERRALYGLSDELEKQDLLKGLVAKSSAVFAPDTGAVIQMVKNPATGAVRLIPPGTQQIPSDPFGPWKAQERLTGYTDWVDLHKERPPCSGVWEFGGYGLGSGLKADRRIIITFPDRWFYDKDSDMWHAPVEEAREVGRILPKTPWNSGLFPPETFWRGLQAPWWLGYTYRGVPAPAEYVGRPRVKLEV